MHSRTGYEYVSKANSYTVELGIAMKKNFFLIP